MNTLFINRFAVSLLATTGLGLGFIANASPVSAAEQGSVGYFQMQVGATQPGGTFTLTFNGQTTTPGKEGGRYEYEWKVEEGESLIKPIDGLKSEVDVPDYGREGGNVEYEWKVEEGES